MMMMMMMMMMLMTIDVGTCTSKAAGGSLSKPRRRWQRERHQAKGLRRNPRPN